MKLPRSVAGGTALLMAGLCCPPAAQAAATLKTYPNSTCLVTTVPLYSPDMWTAAAGPSPEANVGVGNWGSNTENSGAGGPGKAKNSADAAQITTAEQDGTEILGYIATDYAKNAKGYSEADIETQMTDWHNWYGISAFFLDEAPTATSHEHYYAVLKSWASAHIGSSAQEWLNMGAYPAASSWMNDANTIMDWEDGSAPATPPSWVDNYPASRFAMIMNAVPDSAGDIAAAVTDIENAHAGAGFVTSDSSYQTLPSWSYWTMFAGDAAGSGCS
jgi:Spherulation-specific family 4